MTPFLYGPLATGDWTEDSMAVRNLSVARPGAPLVRAPRRFICFSHTWQPLVSQERHSRSDSMTEAGHG